MKTYKVGDYQVVVQRKSIKNMYLRVHRDTGEIVLSVPRSMREKDFQSFLQSKYDWIKKAKMRIHARYDTEHRGEEELRADGETQSQVYLWGRAYTVQVEPSDKRTSLVHCDEGQRRLYIYASTRTKAADVLRKFYRQTMERAIEEFRVSCESITKKKASQWKIRKMKSRWGSCALPSGRITLNEELVKRDPICLKYVMIHELVHLYEKYHNARFYNYMDQFMPQWPQIRESLRGPIIEGKEHNGKRI